MLFQNLIKNSSFEDGVLEPWIASNAYINSISSPQGTGKYSVILSGNNVDASIHQMINVVPGESYNLIVSLAAYTAGISPVVTIELEFLDLCGEPLKEGINYSLLKRQLSNYYSNPDKNVYKTSLRVPANSYIAKLTITKKAGWFTTGVVINQAALIRIKGNVNLPTVYVASSGTNVVCSVGDNADVIHVGEGPIAMVKATVGGAQYIYVANEEGTVSVIRVSDNTVIETIDLPGEPAYQLNRNILVNDDESIVYVANYDSCEDIGYVSVIDTATNTLTTSIVVGSNPITLALTHKGYPNSGFLYVINHYSHSLSVVDTCNNTVIDTLELPDKNPEFLVITPDNKYIAIGYKNSESEHFQIWKVSTNTLIKERSHSGLLKCLALSLDSRLLYTVFSASAMGKEVSGFKSYCIEDDLSTRQYITLSDTCLVESTMIIERKLTEGYTILYVSLASNHSSYIYKFLRDTTDNVLTKVANVKIPGSITGFFALSSDGKYIITANTKDNTISYIDTETLCVIETIDVSSKPKVVLLLEND